MREIVPVKETEEELEEEAQPIERDYEELRVKTLEALNTVRKVSLSLKALVEKEKSIGSDPAKQKQIAEDLRFLRALPPRDVIAQGLYLPETRTVQYTIGTDEDLVPGIFHRLTGALTSQGLNVHAGHDDVCGVADCGWGMLFARNAQEAGDLCLISRRAAEASLAAYRGHRGAPNTALKPVPGIR